MNKLEETCVNVYCREIGFGIGMWVVPMIFTYRIIMGEIGDMGYSDAWEYHDAASAIAAAKAWDAIRELEPEGWHRHIPSNRRRPNGDPDAEYIAP